MKITYDFQMVFKLKRNIFKCFFYGLLFFLSYKAFFLIYPTGYFILEKSHENIVYKNTANPKGTGVYIINLDRSKARYDYVFPKAKKIGLPVFRIPAVDGKRLTSDELNNYIDEDSTIYYFPWTIGRGAVGCTLSHIKTWKTFLESSFQYALILEDDINFDPAVLSATLKLLSRSSNLWDINTFDTGRVGRGMPAKVKHFKTIDKNLVIYLSKVSRTSAYIINRSAAKKLLEYALPIRLPVDYYFIRSWEFGLKFTGIEPRIIIQDFGDSIIASSRAGRTEDKSIKKELLSKFFNKQTRLILRLYNLKIYLTLKAQQFFTDFCESSNIC